MGSDVNRFHIAFANIVPSEAIPDSCWRSFRERMWMGTTENRRAWMNDLASLSLIFLPKRGGDADELFGPRCFVRKGGHTL